MKAVETWKTRTVLGILSVIAIVVNVSLRTKIPLTYLPIESARTPSIPAPSAPITAQTSETKKPEPPKEAPPVVAARPKIWPDEFQPTQTIRIPDPVRPATGVMDVTFRPGDDIKFEAAQWWTVRFQGNKPEELENSATDMDEFKKAGMRSVRVRLKSGTRANLDVRFIIERKNPDDYKPLPPIAPNTFRNVRFEFRSFQVNRGHAVIDFAVVNLDNAKTIGVALHGPSSLAYQGEVAIVGSLQDSDGGEYFIDEMLGIKSMHTLTANLASIAPNETKNVSLTFTRRSTIFDQMGKPAEFTLRTEVVINDDLRASAYPPNYQSPNGTLAPGCRIENLMWRFPVRYKGDE